MGSAPRRRGGLKEAGVAAPALGAQKGLDLADKAVWQSHNQSLIPFRRPRKPVIEGIPQPTGRNRGNSDTVVALVQLAQEVKQPVRGFLKVSGWGQIGGAVAGSETKQNFAGLRAGCIKAQAGPGGVVAQELPGGTWRRSFVLIKLEAGPGRVEFCYCDGARA